MFLTCHGKALQDERSKESKIADDLKKRGERTAARDHSLKAKTTKAGAYSQPG